MTIKQPQFSDAVPSLAYLKLGILGFQGSGKTYTAVKFAIGLHKYIKSDKPVYFLDTEQGSDWAIPTFEREKIYLKIAKTRSFCDLLFLLEFAIDKTDILVIDSITHFWNELKLSFCRAHKIKNLSFKYISRLKDEWNVFSDKFVNSRLHIIICGRAGWDWDFVEDEKGERDLVKKGIKMKTEGEFGFEPSLLIEMARTQKVINDKRKILHIGTVLKDRRMDTESLDGKSFVNPRFNDILPHIKGLNIGGDHIGVDTSHTSEGMFHDDGGSYGVNKRKQTILVEEINGLLNMHYPGQTKDDKVNKMGVKKHIFGTYSDEKIANLSVDDLKNGLDMIQTIFKDKDYQKTVDYIIGELVKQKSNEDKGKK